MSINNNKCSYACVPQGGIDLHILDFTGPNFLFVNKTWYCSRNAYLKKIFIKYNQTPSLEFYVKHTLTHYSTDSMSNKLIYIFKQIVRDNKFLYHETEKIEHRDPIEKALIDEITSHIIIPPSLGTMAAYNEDINLFRFAAYFKLLFDANGRLSLVLSRREDTYRTYDMKFCASEIRKWLSEHQDLLDNKTIIQPARKHGLIESHYRGITEYQQFQRVGPGRDTEMVPVKSPYQSHAFTQIPKEIALFTNLQQLILSSNRIKYLPDEIVLLTRLKYLDLDDNHFEEIPEIIFAMTWVKKFNFDHNQIISTPKKIYRIALNGGDISLKGNPVEKSPDKYYYIAKLVYKVAESILILPLTLLWIASILRPDGKATLAEKLLRSYTFNTWLTLSVMKLSIFMLTPMHSKIRHINDAINRPFIHLFETVMESKII